jgi:sterol desaturase/sphingolipid hydroxylase (fatty acid hydroxylase superfamily)
VRLEDFTRALTHRPFPLSVLSQAHSLHHESWNPTSFSGVSMHPIESSIYYSTMFLPIAFGAHPLVMLYTKMDLTIAALVGHDGIG